jgi:hypothetical protein
MKDASRLFAFPVRFQKHATDSSVFEHESFARTRVRKKVRKALPTNGRRGRPRAGRFERSRAYLQASLGLHPDAR